MPYLTCKNCKRIIDEVLHTNALLFANLGKDCSKTAYEKAKVQERQNLRSVRKYDPEMIDRLVRLSD
jgi:hypothetical protein